MCPRFKDFWGHFLYLLAFFKFSDRHFRSLFCLDILSFHGYFASHCNCLVSLKAIWQLQFKLNIVFAFPCSSCVTFSSGNVFLIFATIVKRRRKKDPHKHTHKNSCVVSFRLKIHRLGEVLDLASALLCDWWWNDLKDEGQRDRKWQWKDTKRGRNWDNWQLGILFLHHHILPYRLIFLLL